AVVPLSPVLVYTLNAIMLLFIFPFFFFFHALLLLLFLVLLFPGLFLIVGTYNVLHQPVAHHIALVKLDMRYTLDIFQYTGSRDQAGALILRQVHLGDVPRDDGLGIGAYTCQEHLELE